MCRERLLDAGQVLVAARRTGEWTAPLATQSCSSRRHSPPARHRSVGQRTVAEARSWRGSRRRGGAPVHSQSCEEERSSWREEGRASAGGEGGGGRQQPRQTATQQAPRAARNSRSRGGQHLAQPACKRTCRERVVDVSRSRAASTSPSASLQRVECRRLPRHLFTAGGVKKPSSSGLGRSDAGAEAAAVAAESPAEADEAAEEAEGAGEAGCDAPMTAHEVATEAMSRGAVSPREGGGGSCSSRLVCSVLMPVHSWGGEQPLFTAATWSARC